MLSEGLCTLITSLHLQHRIHFQAYITSETCFWEGHHRDVRIGSNIPIELNIYGSLQDAGSIGRTLSRAGTYLQFPLCRLEGLEYYNPHFFRMEGYPEQASIPASATSRIEISVDPPLQPQKYPKPALNMDSGPQKRFCKYVESKLVNGVNGLGETAAYIPRSALENYWSQQNVDDVLDSHEPPILEISAYIAKHLCHIFSTLVYTGHTRQISWFCQQVMALSDLHLPFSAQELPPNCTWSKDFLEHQ
ncbi:serine threonine kinase [Fusarium phyllophilum]|uniref:Serine threonine kinase n=1 Tax=Fusarium phyllophilum TaxID=47803 RepID=A0A8H5JUX0_9HYPO|nr:serine threonine kinase [Fusarium phyllophilum]